MNSRGYQPVYAHPERYAYIVQNFDLAEELIERGALFQINVNSLTGYYEKAVQKLAEKLIDKGMVHFVGTDCHNDRHLRVAKSAIEKKYYHKALDLDLLNDTLK